MVNVFIGDEVYFFNSKLNEIIKGTIEGFYTEDYSVLKILQKVSDGSIRHVVPIDSVSKDLEEVQIIASKLRRERVNEELSKSVYAGCVVHIKDLDGEIVSDNDGNRLKYQVIAVYTKQARVKLVTHYGEEIGMYDIDDLVITDEDPLFKMEDYSLGEKIVWVEYDFVYEGVIAGLHSSTADVSSIKKLYPVDTKKRVPYYKIQRGNNYEDKSSVLTTIKDIIPLEERE